MNRSHEDELIREEARTWHVHLTSGHADDIDRAAFAAWHASDDRCAEAYSTMLALQAALASDPAIAEMAYDEIEERRAIAGMFAGIIDRLAGIFSLPVAGGLAVAAAAWFLVVSVQTPAPAPGLPAEHIYASETVGDVPITLTDGSRVTLGKSSRVSVAYNAKARLVRLLKGEAQFEVAKDRTRPFVVAAAGTSVRAVGTRFNVRLTTHDVKVDVTEGVVEIYKAAPRSSGTKVAEGATAVRLAAGQQVVASVATGEMTPPRLVMPVPTFAEREILAPHPASSARLRYVGAPLSEVVAAANSRRNGKIVFASPEVADMKITTSFRPGEIDAVLDNLPSILPVEVARTADGGAVISVRE